jgi:hypothetical protein
LKRTFVPGTGLKTIPKLLVHVCPALGPIAARDVEVESGSGEVLAEMAGGSEPEVGGGEGLVCEKSGLGPKTIISTPPVMSAH